MTRTTVGRYELIAGRWYVRTTLGTFEVTDPAVLRELDGAK